MKMEATLWAVTFSIAFSTAILAVACAWWMLLNWVWLKPKKLEKFLREQGFSGNSYKVFHGDVKELAQTTKEAESRPISLSDDIARRILPFHHHIITNFGKNSFIWMGPRPNIHITDPKMIREIFLKHDIFQKEVSPLVKLLVTGMAGYAGEQWFKVRKIATPAFHHDKLKNMLPTIHKSCNDMLRKWEILVSKDESCELDVWPHIQTLTADVISRTAFGSSFEEGRKIFAVLREQINLLIQASFFAYIPGWRFVPNRLNRKLKSNHNEMGELVKGIIKKREEALKVGKASNDDDLLGILMESNHKEIQEKETGMSIEEVIEECKLFYLAGQETTASLLVWTMVLLCIHPEWQERAREEVCQVFGNREPKFEELNQLKVVSQILYEVLRLYSPAPLLTRTNVKEIKLGEIVIPPGVSLSLPIMLVHHDHEYWGDDAKKFNPERFSEGVSKASKNQISFFSFGWGPRICIGQNFALLESKLALAMILQKFTFQLSPTYIHAPTRGATVYPQHGANIILHKI
ncbi:cytochrome P450 CYP72A219-like isoform X3 [Citrus sinensis]|uniref:cytochrome P450 CYP72A219-like isoform X3 n=1 Tax=Citrus sinensis TaxID=2711 RepID=UPI002278B3D5|nr:cytochrome P450 CYP72A219-like isoform X3 [Citrus sinensis]